MQEVENIIMDQLTSDMAQAKYAQVLEQLTDLSYQTPDSLDPVLDSLKLKIQHTEPFSRDGGKQPITKNKQVIHAAFSTDVLELGNNSELYRLIMTL